MMMVVHSVARRDRDVGSSVNIDVASSISIQPVIRFHHGQSLPPPCLLLMVTRTAQSFPPLCFHQRFQIYFNKSQHPFRLALLTSSDNNCGLFLFNSERDLGPAGQQRKRIQGRVCVHRKSVWAESKGEKTWAPRISVILPSSAPATLAAWPPFLFYWLKTRRLFFSPGSRWENWPIFFPTTLKSGNLFCQRINNGGSSSFCGGGWSDPAQSASDLSMKEKRGRDRSIGNVECHWQTTGTHLVAGRNRLSLGSLFRLGNFTLPFSAPLLSSWAN